MKTAAEDSRGRKNVKIIMESIQIKQEPLEIKEEPFDIDETLLVPKVEVTESSSSQYLVNKRFLSLY